jgi:hypothetical protein
VRRTPFMVWPSVAHSLLLHLLRLLAHSGERQDLSRCGRPVRVINQRSNQWAPKTEHQIEPRTPRAG